MRFTLVLAVLVAALVVAIVLSNPGWRLVLISGAALVGIDSYNIDDTSDGNRQVHSVLLARGIPIIEHLCGLGDLPAVGFKFFAVPVKIKNLGSFPVRAFGLVPGLS